ncbi:basic membrane protein A [Alkalibacterium olivapovliticus]|uniref:Basic membrane protein A n=1 Tax=Alkalibacterium olivapovliticus TaxID=99907 RepID=A0A2T0W651_9LACT|nr:BMP family protein [Alkalibacterium olivapovliticus]PRY82188.1 basic membrane protein A [Alkalibacterium olivapovliticus]
MSTIKLRSLLALGTSAFVLAACQGEDAGDTTDTIEDDTEDTATDTGEDTSDETAEDDGEDTEDIDFRIAMITDECGVDDRSFNQSAWEGMNEWAENLGLSDEHFAYYQSNDSADFIPNLNQANAEGYDIIYGIGFMLLDAVNDVADQNPEQNFGIVDDISDRDNVISLTFRDHEAAFLAGVAAAETTETGRVGFIGGIAGPVIDRFETGFIAGVAHVDESIEVDSQYAESFSDAGIGQQIAAGMYASGADVVYHAAGAVGNGVFTEARNRLESDSDEQIWLIGVDRDQEEEGNWDGGNFTLTSTLKGVGSSIEASANQTIEEGFPGGETIAYGLEEEGVDLTRGNMSDDAWAAVEEARQAILDGEIEVPEFTYSE